MKITLYIDEDSGDLDLADALRQHGVNVLTTLEVGMIRRKDDEQLEWATAQGRAIYTCNRGDFFSLHTEWLAEGRSHAGIIFGQQQRFSVGEQMRRLLNLIESKSAEEMVNQVEFLSVWG